MAVKKSETTAQTKKKSAAAVLRERQLGAYREKLRLDEEAVAALEAQRSALLDASTIGVRVSHGVFGEGTVTAQDAATISVAFSFGTKRFVMPSAFVDGFLTADDAAVRERFARYQEICEQIKSAKDTVAMTNRAITILESK